ncbi:MAG: HAMP domain-containing histidine kinase [Flavobacterium sp.]|nr:HAMP domain-containing histidine kinase [Flavobacterium sp.]
MLNKISKRRFFHVALLALIILLQFLVMLFWYLEKRNDDKIVQIKQEIDYLDKAKSYSEQSQSLLLHSQILYRNYLQNKNDKVLTDYFDTINAITQSVENLNSSLKNNSQNKSKLTDLKNRLNQIASEVSYFDKNNVGNNLFKKFDYQGILKTISLDSIVSRDKVARKNFFSRLMDAISGKSSIQKERIEIIISYEYHNKLKSGEIKSELEKILKDSDQYYRNQLSALTESYSKSDGNSSGFYHFNDTMLRSFSNLIADYNSVIQPLKEESNTKFNLATQSQNKHRNYLIFSLTLLMFLLSLVVFRFTLYAFDLENKLIASQSQILKSLEYKNKIMGMISHEVRSPLNIISLYSKMVVSKVKDAEMRDVFNSIQHTTSNLLVLTNQILDYSKNENRKMVLNQSKFYLKQELDKIIKPLSKLCSESDNQFEWENTIQTDYFVFSDVTKINQLFYNLVGNALKFTKKGQIKLTTRTEENAQGRINLLVTVADTGVGISKDDLKNVFEDYYQGSNGITSMGIGLGLKLCKEIVDLFDGEISIVSELNEGTAVSFRIQMDGINK